MSAEESKYGLEQWTFVITRLNQGKWCFMAKAVSLRSFTKLISLPEPGLLCALSLPVWLLMPCFIPILQHVFRLPPFLKRKEEHSLDSSSPLNCCLSSAYHICQIMCQETLVPQDVKYCVQNQWFSKLGQCSVKQRKTESFTVIPYQEALC